MTDQRNDTMIIHKASIETRNYEFTAYGETSDQATNALKITFIKHMIKNEGTYKWAEIKDDVYVQEITLNTGYVR